MNQRWQHRLFILLLIVAGLLTAPFLLRETSANSQEPMEIARKLQATYNRSTGMMADFKQETTLNMNRRKRSGAGTVMFLKPALMRWEYISPDQQLLISDGHTISMYFEKEKQMIITPAKDYLQSDVTHSFFSGTGNILRDFEVVDPEKRLNTDENAYLLKLIPKTPHPHVARLYVWTTKDSFFIKRIQIIDHFDTITDIFFDNIQFLNNNEGKSSQKITEDLFTFTPPPGTEIIRQ